MESVRWFVEDAPNGPSVPQSGQCLIIRIRRPVERVAGLCSSLRPTRMRVSRGPVAGRWPTEDMIRRGGRSCAEVAGVRSHPEEGPGLAAMSKLVSSVDDHLDLSAAGSPR